MGREIYGECVPATGGFHITSTGRETECQEAAADDRSDNYAPTRESSQTSAGAHVSTSEVSKTHILTNATRSSVNRTFGSRRGAEVGAEFHLWHKTE